MKRFPRRPLATLPLPVAVPVPPLRADDNALHEEAYGPEPAGGVNGPESIIRVASERLEFAIRRRSAAPKRRDGTRAVHHENDSCRRSNN